jgi:hypothetical protein
MTDSYLTAAIQIPLAIAVGATVALYRPPVIYDKAYFDASFQDVQNPRAREAPLITLPAWADGSFGSLQIDLVGPAPIVAKGR